MKRSKADSTSVESERSQPEDSFVERATSDTAGKTTSGRISLRMSDDGLVDWENTPDKTKSRLRELLSSDPNLLEMVGEALGGEEGEGVVLPGQVTEKHIHMFLEAFAAGERFLIPWFIKSRTKGQVKLNPEKVSEVYQFSDEDKALLGPSGAQWANESLPEWIRKWITEVGPGAQFFGHLAFISYMQTKMLLDDWKKEHSRIPGVQTESEGVN